jgi:alkaline phosphatase
MSGESDHQPEEISVIYGSYDPFTVTVTHILNNKVGIDWGTYSHTGVPVPVFALGQGDTEFNGYYDNTDVAKKIIDIAKYDKN